MFVSLFSMFILMALPHYFDYFNCRICFQIRYCKSSSFEIALAISGLNLNFQINFMISLSNVTKNHFLVF